MANKAFLKLFFFSLAKYVSLYRLTKCNWVPHVFKKRKKQKKENKYLIAIFFFFNKVQGSLPKKHNVAVSVFFLLNENKNTALSLFRIFIFFFHIYFLTRKACLSIAYIINMQKSLII